MVDPKEQAQKMAKKAEEPVVEPAPEVQGETEALADVREQAAGPLTEVLKRVEQAYAAYVDAEKEVARVYKSMSGRWRKPTKRLSCRPISLVSRVWKEPPEIASGRNSWLRKPIAGPGNRPRRIMKRVSSEAWNPVGKP